MYPPISDLNLPPPTWVHLHSVTSSLLMQNSLCKVNKSSFFSPSPGVVCLALLRAPWMHFADMNEPICSLRPGVVGLALLHAPCCPFISVSKRLLELDNPAIGFISKWSVLKLLRTAFSS
jgi:hypothetical protein